MRRASFLFLAGILAAAPAAAEDLPAKEASQLEKLADETENHASAREELAKFLAETEETLLGARSERATLADQLAFFAELAREKKAELAELENAILEKETAIAALRRRIFEIEKANGELREALKKFARELARVDDRSPVELFLRAEDFSEMAREIRELELAERAVAKVFEKAEAALGEISKKKRELTEAATRLDLLRQENLRQQSEIAVARAARQRLLELTSSDERKFQFLLDLARHRQADLDQRLSSLVEKLRAERSELLQELERRQARRRELGLAEDFIWPVDPSRGLTAGFRDPDYARYFGVQHEAIDIRAAQGTPILAPAAGVVVETYLAGTDFGFVLLAHTDGLETLFGHVTEILVKEGQLVNRGQVIAKSGGMPGTRGAGWMTTGPHLHFEVRQGKEKIDPLRVLPRV